MRWSRWPVRWQKAARVAGLASVLCVALWAAWAGHASVPVVWSVLVAWVLVVWALLWVEDALEGITCAINDPDTWRTSTWLEGRMHLLTACMERQMKFMAMWANAYVGAWGRWYRSLPKSLRDHLEGK